MYLPWDLTIITVLRNAYNFQNSIQTRPLAKCVETLLRMYLVLAISTGIDAAVVTSPLIILAQKWRNIPSLNQPEIKHGNVQILKLLHQSCEYCPNEGKYSILFIALNIHK